MVTPMNENAKRPKLEPVDIAPIAKSSLLEIKEMADKISIFAGIAAGGDDGGCMMRCPMGCGPHPMNIDFQNWIQQAIQVVTHPLVEENNGLKEQVSILTAKNQELEKQLAKKDGLKHK